MEFSGSKFIVCTIYKLSFFRFRALQVQNEGKVSEIHNEARLKAFEAERTSMVYEETVRTLKEVQVENEKLNKKLEVRFLWLKFPVLKIHVEYSGANAFAPCVANSSASKTH